MPRTCRAARHRRPFGIALLALAFAMPLAAQVDPGAAGSLAPFLLLAAGVIVLAGVAGTVVPALPGTPLVFAGLLLAAWAEGFQKVGWFTLLLLAVLTTASLVIDAFASSLGAQRVGASQLAIAGAIVGGLAGLFFGLPGLFLGPFVGAGVGEYLARRDLKRAGKVGLATWLGILFGSAAKVALAFTMVGLFAMAYAF